jgi:hypothetical protein
VLKFADDANKEKAAAATTRRATRGCYLLPGLDLPFTVIGGSAWNFTAAAASLTVSESH